MVAAEAWCLDSLLVNLAELMLDPEVVLTKGKRGPVKHLGKHKRIGNTRHVAYVLAHYNPSWDSISHCIHFLL